MDSSWASVGLVTDAADVDGATAVTADTVVCWWVAETEVTEETEKVGGINWKKTKVKKQIPSDMARIIYQIILLGAR